MKIIHTSNYTERWSVVFADEPQWRAGIYVPENSSREEIVILERHNRPELFLLIEGEIVLVVSSDGVKVEEVPMEPGKLYVVEEWHNAYRPGGKPGKALVIEAAGIQTEYMDAEGLIPCREK